MTEPCDEPIDNPRVMVFVDGQNLYKGLNRRFKVRLHPLLLARELCGADRHLAGVHYYSGVHDPAENQHMSELVRRRHDLIRRTGVLVTERPLLYHWEWRVEKTDVPPPWHHDAPRRAKAGVLRHRAAREKGIDVALALDAVASILSDDCDVAIIVSRDRDLMEVADEVRQRCKGVRPARVEVAYVSERRGDEDKVTNQLGGYDAFWEIDEGIISAARDDFDYGRPLDAETVDRFLQGLGPV